MTISFRTAKNTGLMILLVIIFLESIFSFATISRSSDRLVHIITVDQVKLRRWYDVSEIIASAKDAFNDYRIGKVDVVAATDLLINRALKEINTIRKLAAEEDEIANINEIVDTTQEFKQSIYAYESAVRKGFRNDASARKMEEIALRTADRVALLGREAVAYVSKRIEENNKAILDISMFSQRMLAFVLFVAIIATIIVAFIMARVLARPIEELVDGTRRLSEGDLSFRVKIDSEDEIGQLARSFNIMAEKLKKSHSRLLASKTYTDNIIKSMTNSLVVINKDTTIRAANQATFDLLGYPEKELVGKRFSMIFAEGYYENIGLEHLIDKGFKSNVETTYLSKNGRKIPVLFTGSAIFDNEGNFEGVVCVAQDTTIQKEALRAGHLASIGELAAGVAHEINNPINGIINFAQILIDEIESGKIPSDKIPSMIIKEGDRVATIVKSLLSFAREGEETKGPVNLHEIIAEVLALTKAQLLKDGVTLSLEVPKNLPEINGNFQQIQQVLLNTINNSRDALNKKYPGPDPGKSLLIGAKEGLINEQPMIEVTILDQGSGIPAHIIDKVMNPFFSTKPAGLGTGLGLAISHGIITDHNGKLLIESDENKYTKVTILFPIGKNSSKQGDASQTS